MVSDTLKFPSLQFFILFSNFKGWDQKKTVYEQKKFLAHSCESLRADSKEEFGVSAYESRCQVMKILSFLDFFNLWWYNKSEQF